MLQSASGSAPALPGSVAATNLVAPSTASAPPSAYEPAAHIPPGSKRAVHLAFVGPDSRSSQSTSAIDAYCPVVSVCQGKRGLEGLCWRHDAVRTLRARKSAGRQLLP